MLLKDFAKIYFTVLLLHLAVLDVGESQILIQFTKPIILLSLIAFYMQHTAVRKNFENKFLIGLIFSLTGDVFLMFTHKGEIWFMLGLGAFLIAQLFYLLAFFKDGDEVKGVVQRYPWLILPFLAYAFWFVNMLKPSLANLVLPVGVYAIALVAMAISALNRHGKVVKTSFLLVFFGALFFVISDSVLAYTKFVGPFSKSQVVVMATYGIAQFLLVWGMLFKRLQTQ